MLLKRRLNGGYLFILPGLLYLAIMSFYPMAYVFKLSLFDKKDLFIGLGNFVRAFHDSLFLQTVQQSIIFVVLSATFHVALGLLLALLLNQKMNRVFRGVMRSLILIPWAITPVVVAVIWRIIYNPHLSIIPEILKS